MAGSAKGIKTVKLGLSVLFVTAPLWAAQTQSAAPVSTAEALLIETKIAFVDTGAVLQNSDEGKKAVSEIEADAAVKAEELDTRSKELQDLRAVYNQQAASMNEVARTEAQNTISQKERDLTRLQEDFNDEVGRKRDQLLQRMAESIRIVVEEYSKENGIGAVFILSPGMPFVGVSVNITDQIIERYNQKFPVPTQN